MRIAYSVFFDLLYRSVRQTLVLSYAYHCCEFLPLMEGEEEDGEVEGRQGAGFSDFVLVPPQHVDPAAWANATDIWTHYRQLSGQQRRPPRRSTRSQRALLQ